MYVRVHSCCVYATVQKFTPLDVSTRATTMKHTCTHTHTHMNACIVMNDKFVRMCMCSLGYDYGHFCHTCSPTDSTRMMQMEYQRKKASSELQQALQELDMAQVSGMRVQTHLYAHMFA